MPKLSHQMIFFQDLSVTHFVTIYICNNINTCNMHMRRELVIVNSR